MQILIEYHSATASSVPVLRNPHATNVGKQNDYAAAPNDHRSYTRLGQILGPGNKQAVKAWMASRAFKPAFQRLYN
ncbi:hypothetical protein V502_05412 [Pseudogymnoascus sp. VKM F-4520 (FW-2644)]|nr:hypothetical protein V502_05412 [Pseudogymnoascus sp. VKM F-4520 (FW-2644)]